AVSIGYGATHVNQWATDQAPLDTMANRYAGSLLAVVIDLMVAISAFVASLAGLNLASRMLFAMGRDGGIPKIFGQTHSRYRTPWVAIVTTLALTLLLGATLGQIMGPFTMFGFLSATASLGILLTYILVALSGAIFFLRSDQKAKKGLSLVL